MHLLSEVPYQPDTSRVFDGMASDPWAVFLDSGRPGSEAGRYDILTSDPGTTLVTKGGFTEIRTRGGKLRRSRADPFTLLREQMGDRESDRVSLPFGGGAVGWFSYDLARRIEQLPAHARDDEALPEMAVGIYDWALVVDHQEHRSWLVSHGRERTTHRQWWRLLHRFSASKPRINRDPFRVIGPVTSNFDAKGYSDAFARVHAYIRDGDCYQVNLAQRFSAPARGDGWGAYTVLRERSPAPFSAFLNTPYAQILSVSPERFLQVTAGVVETRPIKGTRPRGSSPEADSEWARELSQSEKDRAENLMIVDLLRNDLGRVCQAGSVRVPSLFAVEGFSNVHHLVSTVTGKLNDDQDAIGLLRACFPGGSITGAPKIRAMQIIEELEPQRRGLYCGSIGYIGYEGQMDVNIAIRTMIYNQGEIRCWAGGGIVFDSTEAAEFQETLDKATAMLSVLRHSGRIRVGG
ncbi:MULTISPECIES: aminodeoxychorismate synthase component I [unclassified Thioalkalivibrio]|uniref:aminodeoxychorismate synthase component I n=1 Tax=unclassified Thioalkalivibrio TaxID=2621013 RepID=UPI00039EDF8B|nr:MULTISPECIES: aminodeoxychorismate synthase component I [unclassified Thioalkalivibrio]